MAIKKDKLYLILANYNPLKSPDGWVTPEHIERPEWCPYGVKSARSHRPKYLEGDPFIEIKETDTAGRWPIKEYRLSRKREDRQRILDLLRNKEYVLKGEEKVKNPHLRKKLTLLGSAWYKGVQVDEENRQKARVLGAADLIKRWVELRVNKGKYNIEPGAPETLLSMLRIIEEDLLGSKEYKDYLNRSAQYEHILARFREENPDEDESTIRSMALAYQAKDLEAAKEAQRVLHEAAKLLPKWDLLPDEVKEIVIEKIGEHERKQKKNL